MWHNVFTVGQGIHRVSEALPLTDHVAGLNLSSAWANQMPSASGQKSGNFTLTSENCWLMAAGGDVLGLLLPLHSRQHAQERVVFTKSVVRVTIIAVRHLYQ
jgi:hypothetical protein